jgi:hypothetical protein
VAVVVTPLPDGEGTAPTPFGAVAAIDGVGVAVGLPVAGVVGGVCVPDDEEPPRLLSVVPDAPEVDSGCPRIVSLTEMTARAARKTRPAATARGFQRIRVQSGAAAPTASGGPVWLLVVYSTTFSPCSPSMPETAVGVPAGCSGTIARRTTRVRLTRAARLSELA